MTGAPAGRAAFAGVISEGGYPQARARPPGGAGNAGLRTTSRHARSRSARAGGRPARRRCRAIAAPARRPVGEPLELPQGRCPARHAPRHGEGIRRAARADVPRQAAAGVAARARSSRGEDAQALRVRQRSSRPSAGRRRRAVEDDDQVTGKLCETFVVGELLKHASWSEQQPRLYHYQRDREDVDLVLENNRGQIVGVEVKAAATLRAGDWKWLAKMAEARATGSAPGSSCMQASRRFRWAGSSGPCRIAACGRSPGAELPDPFRVLRRDAYESYAAQVRPRKRCAPPSRTLEPPYAAAAREPSAGLEPATPPYHGRQRVQLAGLEHACGFLFPGLRDGVRALTAGGFIFRELHAASSLAVWWLDAASVYALGSSALPLSTSAAPRSPALPRPRRRR